MRGESIVHDGWRFTAAEVEGRRIRRVRVSLQSATPATEPSDDGGTRSRRSVDS